MTPIERETYRDGFRVGLLCGWLSRGRPGSGYQTVLFDGGREVDRLKRVRPGPLQPEDYLDLRRFLARVAAAPHILAGHGPGWRELASIALAEYLPVYRVLDLRRSAVRLAAPLPAGADDDALAHAYGLPWHDSHDDGPPTGWASELLWAVLADAGRRGLDWPGLLRLSTADPYRVGFDRYGFDEQTLHAAPSGPGVYIMRDRGGGVLYVGKASNLQRRLQEYFRAVTEVPAKIAALRERIHDLEIRPVGSELEALLLEQQCIDELTPAVNTHRTVAEGASRYAPPPGPVLMILPSTRPRCVEMFGFAAGRPGMQLRLRPSRPARRAVETVVAVLQGARRHYPRRPDLTVWGPPGTELMIRYFGRRRDRIAWLEAVGSPSRIEPILTAARIVLTEPPEAVEFRDETATGPSRSTP